MSYIKNAQNPLKMLLTPSPVRGGVAVQLRCQAWVCFNWGGPMEDVGRRTTGPVVTNQIILYSCHSWSCW